MGLVKQICQNMIGILLVKYNTLYFYDDKFFNNPTSTSSPRILKIKYKLDTTIDESPYIQEK